VPFTVSVTPGTAGLAPLAGIPQLFVILRVVLKFDVHVFDAELDETVFDCVVIPSGMVDELSPP
jgi:hypothetical protein